MKILALETATLTGGVSVLSDENGLIAELRLNIRVAHAERLMSAIDWILHASALSLIDIDAFAVSIGPGSFTGLRIGLSTAKGLSYSTGKPVVPVPTLDAMARTLPFCPHFICPMLDARKNEVYTALYKWEDGFCKKIVPEMAIRPQIFLKEINRYASDKGGQTVFFGNGAELYRGLIEKTLFQSALFPPPSKMLPSACAVGEIALLAIKEGRSFDPITLTPFYIRKSEAEIYWKG